MQDIQEVKYDVSTAPMLADKASKLFAVAQAYKVNSPAMFEAAGEDLKAIKAQAKVIEETRTSITGPLNAALKNVNDLFRAPAKFCADAEALLKGAMTTFTIEEQRKEREAQAAREAEAVKERQRLAAEAAAAQKLADEAAAAGDIAKAEELQEQAQASTSEASLIASMPATAPTQTKVAGISMRDVWGAEVTDLKALVQAVAAGTVPLEAIAADIKFLGNQARALKGNLNYPGVRAVNTPTMAARA